MDIAISSNPDLALDFKAKSGGTGSFAITSAKVDAAANAEKNAPEANVGAAVNVTVDASSVAAYKVTVTAPETVTNGDVVEVKLDVAHPNKDTYNYFYATLSYPSHILSYAGESTVNGYSVTYNDRTRAYVIESSGSDIAIDNDAAELTLTFKAMFNGSGTFSIGSARIDYLDNPEQTAEAAERGSAANITVVAKKTLGVVSGATGDYTYSLFVNDVLVGENLAPGSRLDNIAAYSDIIKIVTKANQAGYGVAVPTVYDGETSSSTLRVTDNGDGVFVFSIKTHNALISTAAYPYAKITIDSNIVNGTLSAEATAVSASGTTVKVMATPNFGYKLDSISYSLDNGSTWTAAAHSDNSATITVPGDAVITARFIQTEEMVITSKEEIKAFAARVNSGDPMAFDKVKLANDIDLGNEEWVPIGCADSEDERLQKVFSGTFDGQGHTISGLRITDEKWYASGLFGIIDSADISNVNVRGEINSGRMVGSIAGVSKSSVISDCKSYVAIKLKETEYSSFNAGGIIGWAYGGGVISSCENYGTVAASETGGGIAGRADGSAALEKFSGRVAAGGIAGYAGGTITECVNKGAISASNSVSAGASAAGIAARAQGNELLIKDSYNTGDISVYCSATKRSGEPGVAGIFAERDSYSGIVIENCYNTGKLTKSGNYNSTVSKFGEIAPEIELTGNEFSGISETPVSETDCKQVNCYSTDQIAAMTSENAAATLSISAYKADTAGVNKNNTPLLVWESGEIDTTEYRLAFDIKGPADYTTTLYKDNTVLSAENDGTYLLVNGEYSYVIASDGFVTESGTAYIVGSAQVVSVEMREAGKITFSVTPSSATLVVKDPYGNVIEPDGVGTGGTPFFWLAINEKDSSGNSLMYSYEVNASGYNSLAREFSVAGNAAIDVVLTESAQGQVEEGHVITPDNVPYIITDGGNYDLSPGEYEQGIIFIRTTDPVTIIGSGIAENSISNNLRIECETSSATLTLQDVYITQTDGQGNMINFRGAGNELSFSGTNILDKDTGASGYAMIHVPDSTELTVTGGMLYLYKREQGAGIGGNGGASGGEGQTAETNGNINIAGATIYGKNSKQGALIGAGAQAGSQRPGDINIEDSTLYLIAISRGAAIGGSAGGGGASSGTNVTVSGSQITINVDFSGAAIGGGGYDAGNDSDGGTLIYESGSIRTFIDYNAVAENLWPGVTEPGVNRNAGITASVENSSGEPLYLLVFNTESVGGYNFTVKENGRDIYSGRLHEYTYINEALHKDSQVTVNYTLDNWTSLDDPNLYLYLTGEDHTIEVNGKSFTAEWNADSQTFTVKDASGAVVDPGGSGGTTAVPTTTESEVPSTTNISGDTATVTVSSSDLEKASKDAEKNTQLVVSADVPKDANVDTVTTQLPADGMKAAAASGASLKVETPVGDIVLSNTALNDITKDGGDIQLTVTQIDGNKTSVAVTVDGKVVDEVKGGVKVAVPAKDGQVAVLVKENGTEVIQKSVVEDGQAYVLLDGSAKIEIVDNNKKFDDVKEENWFKSAVDFVSSHELFIGVSETDFAPNLPMTRAMMVTVLYRLEGSPESDGVTAFDDVDSGTWYTKAVEWATEAGVVMGYDDKTFGTEDKITREQMAVMFYRYAQYVGMDTSATKDLTSSFPDGKEVSEWAQEAMSWCAAVGLFRGDDTGALNPGENATRAEVATIYQRMVELMVK